MKHRYETLLLSIDGHIARLELNRPDVGNAFDEVMHREFTEALKNLRSKEDVRAILLSGVGKTFSAGGDFNFIRKLRSNEKLRLESFNEGLELFDLMATMTVPMVCAVHGHAMGLGATIVSLSDISVMWRDARIADPHVKVGLVAGDGGAIGWASAIGFNRARRYLLTGDALTGVQAHAMGLVTDIADTPEDTIATAEALAQHIASLPPIAVQGTKRAFNALADVRNGEAQRIAFEAEQVALMSDDLEEALAAAVERRAGIYCNR